jgi:hypothetical protein
LAGTNFLVGELFLGQSFGGLESGETPLFLSDIELFFILADIQWNHPWLAIGLSWIPLQSVQYFLGAMQRLADVSSQIPCANNLCPTTRVDYRC